ncbi:MAG: hypothetical protein IPJ15_09500 [Actinomycetales bacterium]|nr:hypothetical protein [Candidatus Phosphoribacter baldrii]
MPSAAAQAVLSALLEVGPPADGAWVGVTGIRTTVAWARRRDPCSRRRCGSAQCQSPCGWSQPNVPVCRPLTQADGIPAARWCGEGNWG